MPYNPFDELCAMLYGGNDVQLKKELSKYKDSYKKYEKSLIVDAPLSDQAFLKKKQQRIKDVQRLFIESIRYLANLESEDKRLYREFEYKLKLSVNIFNLASNVEKYIVSLTKINGETTIAKEIRYTREQVLKLAQTIQKDSNYYTTKRPTSLPSINDKNISQNCTRIKEILNHLKKVAGAEISIHGYEENLLVDSF